MDYYYIFKVKSGGRSAKLERIGEVRASTSKGACKKFATTTRMALSNQSKICAIKATQSEFRVGLLRGKG